MARSFLLVVGIALLAFPEVTQAQEPAAVLLPIGAAPYTAYQSDGAPTASGWAALAFRIDAKGRAYAVTVLESSGDPKIASAATAAVDRWEFSPFDRLEFACALALAQAPDAPLDLVSLHKAFAREPLCSLQKQMIIPAGNTLIDDR